MIRAILFSLERFLIRLTGKPSRIIETDRETMEIYWFYWGIFGSTEIVCHLVKQRKMKKKGGKVYGIKPRSK